MPDSGDWAIKRSVIPDDLALLAGRVSLNWASIDDEIFHYSKALAKENDTEFPPGLGTLAFEKRCKFFIEEMRKRFNRNPTVMRLYEGLIAEAVAIARQRHLLLHGRIVVNPDHRPGIGTTDSVMAYNKPPGGNDIECEFTADDMISLIHRMDVLTGKLSSPLQAPGLSPQDRSALQIFLDGNPRILANPAR